MSGDFFTHVGGHDGLDQHRIFGHSAQGQAAVADVVQQQHTRFIAGQQLVFALGVFHRDAAAVAVRVSGQQQVGVQPGGGLQSQLHSFPDLGIGIGAGGEMAVGLLLLLDHGHVGVTAFPQGAQDGL